MSSRVELGRASSVLFALLGCSSLFVGCGRDPAAAQDAGTDRVRFELGSTNNGAGLVFTPPFYFETDTAALAQAGRDAIGRNLFVNGCITQESAPYNDPYWRFRFVSILGFAEVGIEVCDADIQAANLDWPAYFSGAAPCDTGGVQL